MSKNECLGPLLILINKREEFIRAEKLINLKKYMLRKLINYLSCSYLNKNRPNKRILLSINKKSRFSRL